MQTKDTGGIRIVPTGSPPPAPCTVTAISFTARNDRPHAACKPDGGASAVTPPGRPCRRQIRAFSVPAGHAWSCELAKRIAMRRAGSAVV